MEKNKFKFNFLFQKKLAEISNSQQILLLLDGGLVNQLERDLQVPQTPVPQVHKRIGPRQVSVGPQQATPDPAVSVARKKRVTEEVAPLLATGNRIRHAG